MIGTAIPGINLMINSDDPNLHGKIRKLSMTCQLTDGSEYQGGELQFDCRNYDPHMRDEDKTFVNCKRNIT